MGLKSTFNSDLKKEQQLTPLVDTYYSTFLNHYTFKRVHDKRNQFAGIDLILEHKTNGYNYAVDEKAQLDYINEDLPTFAFEISYKKGAMLKKGWLFDVTKKTEFYSLITAIYSDERNVFTSCKITLVNRLKLIAFLTSKKVTERRLESYIENSNGNHGKVKLNELNDKKEGYLYVSRNNKVEQPVNLVLRLDFLILNGLAKRLI